MNDASKAEPDGNILAIHEAGHLVVGVLLGRRPIKVSLDLVDGKRGCFWDINTKDGWDDFSEMRSLLAGPRAQVTLLPASVAPEKLLIFQKRIIQPSPSRGSLPEGVYDFTGWQFDIRPVFDYLTLPDAPAISEFPFGTTRKMVVTRSEEVLLRFFGNPEIQVGTIRIAEELRCRRCLPGDEALALVNAIKALDNGGLAWD